MNLSITRFTIGPLPESSGPELSRVAVPLAEVFRRAEVQVPDVHLRHRQLAQEQVNLADGVWRVGFGIFLHCLCNNFGGGGPIVQR